MEEITGCFPIFTCLLLKEPQIYFTWHCVQQKEHFLTPLTTRVSQYYLGISCGMEFPERLVKEGQLGAWVA